MIQDEIKQETIIFGSLEEVDETLDNSAAALLETEEKNLVLNTNLELDLQIEQMMEKNGHLWQCKVCGKTSRDKTSIKMHTETHIVGASHTCDICNKTCPNRNSLRVHKQRNHNKRSPM